MPPDDRAKRSSAPAGSTSSPHKHSSRAYVAEIVSIEEFLRVVHARGVGDDVVGWVAGRQLALITVEQLNAAGIGRAVINRRASAGFLHRMYRGVYLVGHPIPLPGARELGAVLACGHRTFVCNRSAAGLWGLLATPAGPVDVTVVRRRCRTRENLRVHIIEELDLRDQRRRRGIPVTAPARTLIDLAAEAEDDELEAAVSEARAQRLIKDGDIEAALERAGNRRGVGRMRQLLRREGDQGYTQSRAERVVRVTWLQLRHEPVRVAAVVAAALTAGRPPH
jgi:hypothetical protein